MGPSQEVTETPSPANFHPLPAPEWLINDRAAGAGFLPQQGRTATLRCSRTRSQLPPSSCLGPALSPHAPSPALTSAHTARLLPPAAPAAPGLRPQFLSYILRQQLPTPGIRAPPPAAGRALPQSWARPVLSLLETCVLFFWIPVSRSLWVLAGCSCAGNLGSAFGPLPQALPECANELVLHSTPDRFHAQAGFKAPGQGLRGLESQNTNKDQLQA